MRVIYFVSLFPCWSETFIVREIVELIKLGVDVRIVSLKHPVEKLVQSDAKGLLDRVVYPKTGLAGFISALTQCFSHPWLLLADLARLIAGLAAHPTAMAKTLVVWWRSLGLIGTLKGLRADHLHAHWATYPSTAAMVCSRRLDVPFSFTAHAHDIFLEDHYLAEKMRRAAFGVTISEFNRNYLATNVSPIARERMRIVHCGVSPRDFAFSPSKREPGQLLAVGRLDEIKGFRHLIEACRILAERKIAFHCNVIGEGPLRAELEGRIADASLGANVTLLGVRKQEEVRQFLAKASMFVLPSVVTSRGDRDGIPVALMEAMAVGLPVVSTRVSGIPELVEHGVSGLLAEPGNAENLADCIQQMLVSPETALKMAQRARQQVEHEFDIAIEARKLHQAFA